MEKVPCRCKRVFPLLLDRYYSCYYPESDAFRQRVASIVNYFRENGYNIIMDVMVSDEINSQGPTRWGESQIRKAKKVLIFLSPGLVNLALDDREDSQSQVFLFFSLFFKCLAQEHNRMTRASARTRTARSGAIRQPHLPHKDNQMNFLLLDGKLFA